MPIYNLECHSCGHKFKKLLKTTPSGVPCPVCHKTPVSWAGKGPTSRIVEVRDNGIMPKKVEQLADIQEIVKKDVTPKSDGEII